MSAQQTKVREKEHELRSLLYQLRNEPALKALVELQTLRQATALVSWRSAKGEDLVKWQTAYNAAQITIDDVQVPPFRPAP